MSLKQNIKSLLTEVETFLVETLKAVKLSNSIKDQKTSLLAKVRQLLDDIDPGSAGSAGSLQDSNASNGSLKTSGGGDSGGGSSSGSFGTSATGDKESGEGIPKVAARDLPNKFQAGLLDRKKASGFKSWEQMYCVVSNNIFYLYKKQGDGKQKEAFCLNGYEFCEAPDLEKDTSRKDMCFELTSLGEPTYQFRAGSQEGMEIWKEAITKGIQLVPEEGQGLYLNLTDFHDPHTYLNTPEEQGGQHSAYDDDEEIYDCVDEPPYQEAPPVPSHPPPTRPTESRAGQYQNLPAVFDRPAPSGKGGVKGNDAGAKAVQSPTERPPMVNIFEKSSAEGETSDQLVSVKETLKRLNSPPSANQKRASLPATSATKRQSQPAADDLYDDCTSEWTPVKSGVPGSKMPANQNKGRELPPPPSSTVETGVKSKVESKTEASKAVVSSADQEDMAPAPNVKNLRMMFQ